MRQVGKEIDCRNLPWLIHNHDDDDDDDDDDDPGANETERNGK